MQSASSGILLCLLAIAPVQILAYGVATASGRFMPMASTLLVLCGAAVLLVLAVPSRPRIDRGQALLLAAGSLGLLLPAAVQCWDGAPATVWWKSGEHLLALVLAGCVMTAQVPLGRLLHVFLASCSLAMVMAFIPIWWHGGLPGSDPTLPNTDFWFSFGLGNPNQLVNTCGLGALGHLVWIVAGWREERPRHLFVLLAVAGVLLTAVLAITMARRGIALAGCIGCAVWGLGWLWRDHRRLAQILIAALAVLLLLGIAYAVSSMATDARSERGLLYLTAWDSAGTRWWAGQGHYAIRLSQFTGSEASLVYHALGVWSIYAHSEPLDALLDAGVLGLGLFLAIAALIWHRIWHLPQGRDRCALIVLIGGASVIACIDNAYSRLNGAWWLACVVGLACHATPVEGRIVTALRPVAWLAAGFAAWATTTLSSSAFMAADAVPSIHVRTVRQTIEPELLVTHAGAAATMLEQEGDAAAVEGIYEVQMGRMGPTQNSLHRYIEAQLRLGRPAEGLVVPMRLLVQVGSFDAAAHRLLAKLLLKHPGLARSFSPVAHERAARWSALPGMAKLRLPLPPPGSAQEAATQLAQLSWALVHQADDPGIAPSLVQLNDRYPTTLQGTAVILQFISMSSRGGEFPLDPARIARLYRAYPGGLDQEIMGRITTVEQAARMRPFLAVRYANEIDDVANHRISPGPWMHEADGPERRNGTLRLLALAGLDGRQPR